VPTAKNNNNKNNNNSRGSSVKNGSLEGLV
jgi:hypothetical protein